MCGIVGFLTFGPLNKQAATATLQNICDSIHHRGPDGDGLFVDPGLGVALGHRRLSIVDLSETGNQPMASTSGRYTTVYNGEIYGYLDIRAELLSDGVLFRGTSDTEVLLAEIEKTGVRAALERANGMFAVALLDHKTRKLILARDRLGKKPLYVGYQDGQLVFGSELKALRAHEAFSQVQIDQESLSQYMRYGYIPSPRTIYQSVIKIPPGSLLELDVGSPPDSAHALIGQIQTLWSPQKIAQDGLAQSFETEAEALNAINRQLYQAVEERMIADVPVGAFLSGGIDSTLITAIMQNISADPVTSFTVRFDESESNEADYALAVANYLGTCHHEVSATPNDALELMGDLPFVFDEPFADPSQIPTLLVSKLARAHLKVALSGDGGDEAFGGYARYKRMMAFEHISKYSPTTAARLLSGTSNGIMKFMTSLLNPVVPRSYREDFTPDRLGKLANILSQPDFRARYDTLNKMWDPTTIMKAPPSTKGALLSCEIPDGMSKPDAMMLIDTLVYLPEDILVKVDRSSMSVGLEVRAPLLDHRLISLAWRSAASLRFDGNTGKVALRRLLKNYLPETLFDRPKQGFGIPINDWLRGSLRDHAAQVFETDRRSLSYFNQNLLRRKWREHLSAERNWGPHLWTVLMFDAWHERWM